MHRFVFLLAISGNNYLCSCHNKVCWFVWEMKCKQILIYLFIYCCWQSLSWYCLISAEKCLWNIIQQYYIIHIDHSSCANHHRPKQKMPLKHESHARQTAEEKFNSSSSHDSKAPQLWCPKQRLRKYHKALPACKNTSCSASLYT